MPTPRIEAFLDYVQHASQVLDDQYAEYLELVQ